MSATRKQSSFYWPMRLLPKPKREALFSVYAFCGAVDELADGTLPLAEKLQALAAWRQQVDMLYAGHPSHPVMQSIQPTLETYPLPQHAFDAMLNGMEMDITGQMCCPEDTLLDQYCYNVASSVGLLAIEIFGHRHDSCHDFAIHLGKGLQFINILRDIEEDAVRGRVYIPCSIAVEVTGHPLMAEHIHELARQKRAAIRKILAGQAIRHFEQADTALHPEDRHTMLPALMMRNVYGCYLARYHKQEWISDQRPHIAGWQKMLAILNASKSLTKQPFYQQVKTRTC